MKSMNYIEKELLFKKVPRLIDSFVLQCNRQQNSFYWFNLSKENPQ